MTREEIIALAVEAGAVEMVTTAEKEVVCFAVADLEKFYQKAYQRGVRDEREACIKDCMSNISPQMMAEGDWPAEAAEMVMFCVADIRKRSKC